MIIFVQYKNVYQLKCYHIIVTFLTIKLVFAAITLSPNILSQRSDLRIDGLAQWYATYDVSRNNCKRGHKKCNTKNDKVVSYEWFCIDTLVDSDRLGATRHKQQSYHILILLRLQVWILNTYSYYFSIFDVSIVCIVVKRILSDRFYNYKLCKKMSSDHEKLILRARRTQLPVISR